MKGLQISLYHLIVLFLKMVKIQNKTLWILLLLCSIIYFSYYGNSFIDRYEINDDVRVHYTPSYLFEENILENDIQTELFFYETPIIFLYIIFLLSKIVDIILLSKILSFIIYLLIILFLYKLLRIENDENISLYLSILFAFILMAFPSISGGLPRSFSYFFIIYFFYAHKLENNLKIIMVSFFSLIIYPPSFMIIWISYSLMILEGFIRSRVDKKKNKQNKKFLSEFKYFVFLSIIFLILGFVIYGSAQENQFGELADKNRIENDPIFSEDGRINIYPIESYTSLFFKYSYTLLLISLLIAIINMGLFGIAEGKKAIKHYHFSLLISGFLLYIISSDFGLILHFYDRYVRYTIPLFILLFLGVNLDLLLKNIEKDKSKQKKNLFLFFFFTLIIISIIPSTSTDTIFCDKSESYNYLLEANGSILVAGHPYDMSCIPLYSKKPVFISYEGLAPEYSSYYEIMKNRTNQVFSMYYSSDIDKILNFCEINNITHLLVSYRYFQYENMEFISPFNSLIKNITINNNKFILNNISSKYKIINTEDYYLMKCEDLKNEK
ncbi:hypothetical protein C0585_01320 [Candidatus Woesearchaeota archaeon]|nr:MAG: hypothetical protein C0585_01320 [Candidatus Woesearchaeota archaeon]